MAASSGGELVPVLPARAREARHHLEHGLWPRPDAGRLRIEKRADASLVLLHLDTLEVAPLPPGSWFLVEMDSFAVLCDAADDDREPLLPNTVLKKRLMQSETDPAVVLQNLSSTRACRWSLTERRQEYENVDMAFLAGATCKDHRLSGFSLFSPLRGSGSFGTRSACTAWLG